MSRTLAWKFDNSYAKLPEAFYVRQDPLPVRAPQLAVWNHGLAAELGLSLEEVDKEHVAAVLAGNLVPDGAIPLAQAYAGCQFGHFTMLGDGRAILLGEQITPDGARVDIQLKGSGRTRFSRGGDGRAALGPMLREYIISEAMRALGIPTTRSLAVVATGEPVYRERPLPGAVLTRVASSHLRVGTFEYFAHFGSQSGLKTLADYTIQRHDPQLQDADRPYLELLKTVMERQIDLVIRWLSVGFVHGVMNTDNMSIAGETIDYGPCAFMDSYSIQTVFSSIDHQGRYAYGNQPQIVQWNLARFAETLLPLIDPDQQRAMEDATTVLRSFVEIFQRRWHAELRAKLGLTNEEPDDESLSQSLLRWMQRTSADYTNTWRRLATGSNSHEPSGQLGPTDVDPDSQCVEPDELFQDPEFISWYDRWQARLARQNVPKSEAYALMRAKNPAIIPRNHRVEEALAAATDHGDLSVMQRLMEALARPYEDPLVTREYTEPPPSSNTPYRTFCGT
ncbi:MAG: hypothetical protein RIS70_1551 [Planctomycetota bacterium]